MLGSLFGHNHEEADYKELISKGAVVLDVRTKEEFDGGHIKGSINIPVEVLSSNLKKLTDKEKPIIIYCASGSRSGYARRVLQSHGYTDVHNGGGVHSLLRKLQ